MPHNANPREIVGINIRTCGTDAGLTLEKLAEKATSVGHIFPKLSVGVKIFLSINSPN